MCLETQITIIERVMDFKSSIIRSILHRFSVKSFKRGAVQQHKTKQKWNFTFESEIVFSRYFFRPMITSSLFNSSTLLVLEVFIQ